MIAGERLVFFTFTPVMSGGAFEMWLRRKFIKRGFPIQATFAPIHVMPATNTSLKGFGDIAREPEADDITTAALAAF